MAEDPIDQSLAVEIFLKFLPVCLILQDWEDKKGLQLGISDLHTLTLVRSGMIE